MVRAAIHFPFIPTHKYLDVWTARQQEDVTVPYGTFTDCVKIARFRGNQADRIGWYAKGIGLVKMIYAQEPYPTSIRRYLCISRIQSSVCIV
jgi:hypothetical protein